MENADVIIIGAGASGLMTGRELARKGKKVVILEARNRIGGRIHTIHDPSFDLPVESGAEFIHGDLPITFRLLKEAGIEYYEVKGRMLQEQEGKLTAQNIFNEGSEELVLRLKELKEDMSVNDFLETFFKNKKYRQLKNSVKGFVKGFDAADTARASTFTFRDEWLQEEEWQQYRIHNGYGKLVEFLAKEFEKEGGKILLNEIVKEVRWSSGHVEIVSDPDHLFVTPKLIVTVPLGVLCAEEGSKGQITFSPAIPGKIKAARAMGFGPVIKVIVQFNEAFWEDESIVKDTGADLKETGFIFFKAPIPTWWTQFPKNAAMLTGWLAGPNAVPYKTANEKAILEDVLNSLSSIFKISDVFLRDKLTACHIANWIAEPFSQGAYTYETLETKNARSIFAQPIKNTLFFSGEATYDGSLTGTVEAALSSGLDVVKQVLTL